MTDSQDFPATVNTPLVRLDFSDEATWQSLLAQLRAPSKDGFLAVFDVVDDPAFAGADPIALCKRACAIGDHTLCMFADRRTMTASDHPLLCVDEVSNARLLVLPEHLWSVENNLRLSNMEFEEFVESADEHGVFRGF